MYVQGFEGSWFDHPFWKTEFLIEDPDDLARIRASDVTAVVVDTRRGTGAILPAVPRPRVPPILPAPLRPAVRKIHRRLLPPRDDRPCSFEQEICRAQELLRQSKLTVSRMFQDAQAGRTVKTTKVAALVDQVAMSMARNQAALLSITRLKSRHEYTYMHSVAVCTLMINLARALRLDEALVHDIGMAGLLHDVGKMAMPVAILDKPGRLTDEEFALIRDHPARGAALLVRARALPPIAIDVCLHHHEKYDGSGYPDGLAGDRISLYARMAAVCDVYDAVTSARAYKEAWSPGEALERMAGWTGHFDPVIFEAFVRSLPLEATEPR